MVLLQALHGRLSLRRLKASHEGEDVMCLDEASNGLPVSAGSPGIFHNQLDVPAVPPPARSRRCIALSRSQPHPGLSAQAVPVRGAPSDRDSSRGHSEIRVRLPSDPVQIRDHPGQLVGG